MRKNGLNIFLITSVFVGSNSYSQNKNNLIIEVGVTTLIPKMTKFSLYHDKEYADDYYYNLSLYPLTSFESKMAMGYSFTLKNFKQSKITLPILINYKRIKEKNKQNGEYYGGYTNDYFKGNRELISILNVITLSSGLGYSLLDYKKNELIFDILLSGNLNTYTSMYVNEYPINCNTCISSEYKSNYKDFSSFYPSIDIKTARLFKLNKFLLGPFLSYNFNLIPNKTSFNNSYYHLKYFHFIETGLKIKI